MTEKIDMIRHRRDDKVREHLQQYAPVWLVDEVAMLDNDALQFNVVFYHPRYEWVNRRYRYDAFNDVLYHQGQTRVSESQALEYEDQPPYIDAETINTVNSYGG
ncbi:MAG: hypothetical protein GYB65_16570 [Chloroflexi bacterium]|nr:hypothetical protein [Chloroflexota bacterium]